MLTHVEVYVCMLRDEHIAHLAFGALVPDCFADVASWPLAQSGVRSCTRYSNITCRCLGPPVPSPAVERGESYTKTYCSLDILPLCTSTLGQASMAG